MEEEAATQEDSEFTETEPLEQDSGFEGSQSESQSQLDHWGRLYPLKSSLSVIDMVANEISFGNGKINTDFVITKEQVPLEVFSKFSKIHFEIQRQQINVVGGQTTRVVILDRSTNGTYINGRVLKSRSGVQRRKVLCTNDVIGLPAGKSSPCYEVYVYIDSLVHPASTIPWPVRRKYQISLRLGAGAFGEVYLVFDKAVNSPRAMKTVVTNPYSNNQIADSCKKKLLNELRILQSLCHPNVIKLLDTLNYKKEHFLLLEYMEGKDLFHRIQQSGRLDEALAKVYFYQISKGVEYLHRKGITHRDIKPANILLASSNKITLAKLTDFGLSKILSSASVMTTFCGTKMYVAPEVLSGAGSHEYTEQVDLWSLGVVLYVCFSGVEPLASEPEQVEDLIAEVMHSMASSTVSHDAKYLIKRMLTKDPKKRITIDNLLGAHWMQDRDMLDVVNGLYKSFSNDLSETLVNTSSSSLEWIENETEKLYVGCATSPPRKKLKLN